MKNQSANNFYYASVIVFCLSLAACSPQAVPVKKSIELTDIAPRSQVIGAVPIVPAEAGVVTGATTAQPTVKPPGVAAAVPTDVSAKQQATKMPLPGQANDHSTLSKVPSQRTTGQATK